MESRLGKIRARLEKATKGDWFDPQDGESVQVRIEKEEYDYASEVCLVDNTDDIEFIAHSKEDIEYLLNDAQTSRFLMDAALNRSIMLEKKLTKAIEQRDIWRDCFISERGDGFEDIIEKENKN